MFEISQYCCLEKTLAKNYLLSFPYPWQALKELKEYIYILGDSLNHREYYQVERGIWLHKNAKTSSSVCIQPPCIIGDGSVLRHCAFIRGGVLIGENCVVGNSTEIKNSILFDGAQVPHYNYIGDSILGYKTHLGAGAVTSNLKSDKSEVCLKVEGEIVRTGMVKFGAIIGDESEIGCGCVLNPGSIIGRKTTVYPLTSFRGTAGESKIVKNSKITVDKR